MSWNTHNRERTLLAKEWSENQYFINAMRAVLRLEPLYGGNEKKYRNKTERDLVRFHKGETPNHPDGMVARAKVA